MLSWSKPHIQRHIVRVLWMVPIYALNSWMARKRSLTTRLPLTQPAQVLALGASCQPEQYFLIPDALRSCYEAYTLYSFYRFLTAYIEDRERQPLVAVMARQRPMRHILPLRLALWSPFSGWFDVYTLRPWAMGAEFLAKCEYGIHGYVIEKPLSTLATLACLFAGRYHADGMQDMGDAYPYLLAADTFFQCWALYCLILVYLSTHDLLPEIRPTHKFLCVKGVVFGAFPMLRQAAHAF